MAKLFMSFEADEVKADEVPAEEIVSSQAEVEEAHDSVVEAASEVTELTEAVDEGVGASGTLEKLGEIAGDAVKSGEGVSEATAKVVEVAIESIRDRLGMAPSMGRIPSMESFKSGRSRIEATISMENSIVDTIKAIWKKIVEFATKIADSVKSFFGNLMKNYGTLKTHLEKLKAAAVVKSGDMENTTLKNEALAKFFSVDRKASSATVIQSLDTVAGFEPMLLSFSAKITDIINHAHAAKTELGDTLNGIKAKVVPGPLKIKVEVGEDKLAVVDFEEIKEVATEIEAGSKKQIEQVLTKAIEVCSGGDYLKKLGAQIETDMKLVTKTAENVIKNIENDKMTDAKDKEARKEEFATKRKVINNVLKLTSKVSTKLPALHFQTLKRAGDYASASISNLKKEDKK